eukprot:gene14937-biopygen23998
MSKGFWTYAFTCASYLRNRLPSKRGATPYERFFGQVLSLGKCLMTVSPFSEASSPAVIGEGPPVVVGIEHDAAHLVNGPDAGFHMNLRSRKSAEPIDAGVPAGPFCIGIRMEVYHLVAVDDHSGWNAVVPMCLKSESAGWIIAIIRNWMGLLLGLAFRCLRTDQAKEFLVPELTNWLASVQAKHEVSSVYCPQQNGVAERFNEVVASMARTMLIESEMSKGFWTYAFTCASYLRNRLPSKRGATPYERFFGQHKVVVARDVVFFEGSGPGPVLGQVPYDGSPFSEASSPAVIGEGPPVVVGIEHDAAHLVNGPDAGFHMNLRSRKSAEPIDAGVPAGPFCIGIRMEVYHLVAVDDHSGWNAVVPMCLKSESAGWIIAIIRNWMGLLLGVAFRCLRTDQAKEFLVPELTNWLASVQAKHEVSSVYCPQQNGVAERFNEVVASMARTMLIESEMSKGFWTYAFTCASYLRNRLPSKRGATPYERFFGQVPDVSLLRVFGTRCYVKLLDGKTRSKTDERAIRGRLVGYSSMSKAYQIWIPEQHKVVVARDVVFFEGSGPGPVLGQVPYDGSPFSEASSPAVIGEGPPVVVGIEHDAAHLVNGPDAGFHMNLRSRKSAEPIDAGVPALDIKTAFLNATLDEGLDLYFAQPEGFEVGKGLVCKIIKSLYGLKQAPRLWSAEVCRVLRLCGFRPTASDPALFVRLEADGNWSWVTTYVDDFWLALDELFLYIAIIEIMRQEGWTVTEMGVPRMFLSLDCDLSLDAEGRCDKIVISQRTAIQGMLERFRIGKGEATRATVAVPMVSGAVTTQAEGSRVLPNNRLYSSLIGRRSQTGLAVLASGGVVSWVSKRQITPALSTGEAEYQALAAAAREVQWLKHLRADLGLPCKLVTIRCDASVSLSWCADYKHEPRAKHIDIIHHYVKDLVLSKRLGTVKPSSKSQFRQWRSTAKRERLAQTIGISNMAPKLKLTAEEAGPSKEQSAKKQAVRDEDEPKWPMGAVRLIEACWKGDIEATLLMLSRGADKEAHVYVEDNDEWSALHWAADNGHKSCLSTLVEAGADVSAMTSDGVTALEQAVNDGENENVQLVREHGALR